MEGSVVKVGDELIRKQIEEWIPSRLGEGWTVTTIYRYDIPHMQTVWAAIVQCGDLIEHKLFTLYGHTIVAYEAVYQVRRAMVVEEKSSEGSQLI